MKKLTPEEEPIILAEIMDLLVDETSASLHYDAEQISIRISNCSKNSSYHDVFTAYGYVKECTNDLVTDWVIYLMDVYDCNRKIHMVEKHIYYFLSHGNTNVLEKYQEDLKKYKAIKEVNRFRCDNSYVLK